MKFSMTHQEIQVPNVKVLIVPLGLLYCFITWFIYTQLSHSYYTCFVQFLRVAEQQVGQVHLSWTVNSTPESRRD